MTRRQRKTELAIIEEGRQAAIAGTPGSECPYRLAIMSRAAWFIGWERGGGNMRTQVVEKKGATP